MFDIKIICKNKDYYWYDNVKSFISDENTLKIEWWSFGSQKYSYTIFNKSDIKKIKIINKTMVQ